MFTSLTYHINDRDSSPAQGLVRKCISPMIGNKVNQLSVVINFLRSPILLSDFLIVHKKSPLLMRIGEMRLHSLFHEDT